MASTTMNSLRPRNYMQMLMISSMTILQAIRWHINQPSQPNNQCMKTSILRGLVNKLTKTCMLNRRVIQIGSKTSPSKCSHLRQRTRKSSLRLHLTIWRLTCKSSFRYPLSKQPSCNSIQRRRVLQIIQRL